jgi:hypothetical protein
MLPKIRNDFMDCGIVNNECAHDLNPSCARAERYAVRCALLMMALEHCSRKEENLPSGSGIDSGAARASARKRFRIPHSNVEARANIHDCGIAAQARDPVDCF